MDNKITVVVADRTYTLTSPDKPEYIQKVANYVDEQVKKLAEASHASTLDAGIMTALNIADGYFKEQEAVAGFIPDDRKLAVEEYIDPSGNQKLVFHFPFGRRVNDALSRAYAYRLSNMMGANVSVTISDDSFMLGCPRTFDLDQLSGLIKGAELEQILRKSLKDSEIFKLRFRHTAARSFMILRNYMGRPISVNRQQVRSTYLLEALGNMDGVPVIEETYREVMEDDMEIRRLTPRECERLQGFPDDWTEIPYRGKPAEECPDGPRYKAMGNSMAVNVMRWIGNRIDMYEHGAL